MNKGVNQVRQSIAQRRKGRNHRAKNTFDRKVTMPFPQEEEKHGYLPAHMDSLPRHDEKSKPLSSMLLKGVLSLVLFFGVGIVLQSNMAILSKPKEWTNHALIEEFPFARVNKWYAETFGSPLTFTPKDNQIVSSSVETPSLPVVGDLTESFQANGSGVLIGPEDKTSVSAWEEGVIIFAGKDADMNQMVIVQHADGSKSKYGFLSSVDVHLYQYIATGERIGTFSPTDKNATVYFSIEKDNQYIDPIQVIQVDDNP
ncbi:MAG TPA: M23 family metallopeptidase [Virgibacillus sp.]|nr:M23 family metallopeptidase [Virgibacillus sp.]